MHHLKIVKCHFNMNKNLKIIVTGVKGQLGFDCVRELKQRGYTNIIGIDIEELDITNEKAVHDFIIHRKCLRKSVYG